MKKINIQCYDNGRATLKTKDVHIESENIASIIEVDFSQVEYKNYQKGLDIESGSYLLRYFLGNDEVVFKELTYENTLPGELVITPFVFDEVNDRKVRYLTDYSAIIHKRRSIVSQDVPDNVDIILEEVKKFIEDTMGKMVVDMEFNTDTNLLSLILENGDEISTIIDVDVDGVTIVWNEDNEIQLSPLLVDEINTSKDRIETLETKVQTNINDINNLDARIGNAESDIEDINLKDTGQDNRLDIIESDIQDLELETDRLNDEVIRVEQKADAHIEDLNNPHEVTAEQVDTYVKSVIDNKDANTLKEAKDHTYSKVEIDNKDTAVLTEAKEYTDGKISGVFRPSGNWNANTNTPTLANNEPTNAGKVYYVTDAGTQFGLTFAVGDKLAFIENGVATKWDNVDDVTSVNGKIGTVVINADDIPFDGSGTNYLVGKTEVESSLKKLDQVIKEIDYINIQNQDTSEMQKLRLYVVGGQIGYKIEGGE